MRLINLHILCVFILIALFSCYTDGKQVALHTTGLSNAIDHVDNSLDLTRKKRQLENFDNDEYPTALSEDSQEEPGFWDRVVKVALKLFSRFVEWLNS